VSSGRGQSVDSLVPVRQRACKRCRVSLIPACRKPLSRVLRNCLYDARVLVQDCTFRECLAVSAPADTCRVPQVIHSYSCHLVSFLSGRHGLDCCARLVARRRGRGQDSSRTSAQPSASTSSSSPTLHGPST